jgi:PilZ domain
MIPLRSALDSDLPQTFERRAFVRYARRLDALWLFLGVSSRDLTSAKLVDLSVTGVGLIVDQAFPVHTSLAIRLPTITQGWSTHLVRVKRCAEVRAGQYEIGCTFVKPLSATQLQGFLQE